MFGKPEWFRSVAAVRPVVPSGWKGWTYFGGWLFAIVGPCLLLAARHQGPEAVIWGAISTAVLIWDVTKIRRTAAEAAAREVLYIGEE